MKPEPRKLSLGPLCAVALLVLTGCESLPNSDDPWLTSPSPDNVPGPVPPRYQSAIAPAPGESIPGNPPPPVTVTPPPVLTTAERLDELGEGKVYSFSTQALEMRDALALFARTYELNIIPDADIYGSVTLDFRNLPLSKALDALLDAHGYYVEIDRGLIRVRSLMTKNFTVDYIRLVRGGTGTSSVNVNSGSGSSSGGGGSGGSSGGQEVANVSITQNDNIRFWDELQEQLTPLLSTNGVVTINRMAGKVMVTDHRTSVDRIGNFLNEVKNTLHRQVDIEARIYEVILNDEFQLGIDWQNVNTTFQDYMISTGGGTTGIPTSSTLIPNPFGGITPSEPALNLAISHNDAQVVVQALREQGDIQVVSQPRIRTLNNQAALIKVGVDKPFFRTSTTTVTGTGPATIAEDVEVQTITIGTILSLTPQISEDGWITMDISPIITRLIDTALGPNNTTAPEVDVKQTSTLVRMRDNTTIVIGGLIQDERTQTLRKIPGLSDLPLIGKIFTGRFESKRKTELVIFITPTVVRD